MSIAQWASVDQHIEGGSGSVVLWARWFGTAVAGVSVVIGVGVFSPAVAYAASGVAPCLNYADRQPWGTFYADTRPVGGDPIGVVVWHNDIDVVTDRAGYYVWEVYVDGIMVPGLGGAIEKDDNVHGAVPHFMNGKPVYHLGSSIHVEILHDAVGGQRYASIDNRCHVAAHIP